MRLNPNARGEVKREPWTLDAACRDMGPDHFFPERGQSITEARATCARCTVRQPCLEYAVDTGTEYGIFGGLTTKERDHYRRRRNRLARLEAGQ